VITVINFAATRFLFEEMNHTGSEVCRIPKNTLLVYTYRNVSTKSPLSYPLWSYFPVSGWNLLCKLHAYW